MNMKFHWQVLIAIGLGAKRNWHIFFAIVMGAVLGVVLRQVIPIDEGIFDPRNAHIVYQILYVIGQIFVRFIEMIVIPLVLSSLIVGIASLGDGRHLGRLGAKVLAFFVLTTALAAIIGTTLAVVIQPGEAVRADLSTIIPLESTARTESWAAEQEDRDLTKMFLEMIPRNPVQALAQGQLIPIIIFALVFGAALTFIGETARPVLAFFEAVFAATMKIMDWVMVLAVPGIFALTATTVASIGVDVFLDLAPYMGTILLGLLIQIGVVYPILLKFFANVNAISLYKAVIEAMMVAFGTASSNATLPVTIATCERRAGISNRISSFVLPLGATMNMDGTAIFECVAVIFLAQAYDVNITTPENLFILIVMGSIAAIAAAGVPSAGIVTMSLVLASIGEFKPEAIVQGIAMIWMVDRILDMCRTVINVTSDTVVASIVAASEGELDYDLLNNQEAWKDVV